MSLNKQPLVEKVDLSIIIISWNTRDLLAACLQTVLAEVSLLQDMRVETLVIDNVSTDGSADMVEREFPWVRLTRSGENLGFPGGNNLGIQQSSGQYKLLLNPDTEIMPGAIETLIKFLEKNPEVGAVGPYTHNPDGSLQTSCYPAPTLSRELWRLLHLDSLRPYGEYHMSDWDVTTPRETDTLLGACILVRKSVLDKVGLMDEDYFMYSEEVDLCTRIQQAGWSLYWVPQAAIIHHGGQSTRQVATEMFLRLYQSKLYYFKKHQGDLAVIGYKFILFLTATIRLCLSPLAWLQSDPQRQEKLTLAGRYWRLVKLLPSL